MHLKLKNDFVILSLVSIGILTLVGCQGGLTSIPSLNSFNNPTRVPPPPTGSFQVPSSYNDSSGGGASAARSRPTTLGQLRSIETGKSGGDKIESDGVLATEVSNDVFTFTTNPVRTASSNFASESNGPAVVSATSVQDVPGLRSNEAANGSLSSSEENVKWKTPQQR